MATAVLDVDGNLVVTGNATTPNNIVVNSTNPAAVTAQANGQLLGTFNVTGHRIIIHGGSRSDVIQCPGYLPCEIHCGGGNDRVYGPVAGSVLRAESGDVLLVSGSGADVLIGGNGRSTLVGGNGSDILVAGTLSGLGYAQLRATADAFAADPDTDLSALQAAFIPHASASRSQLSGGMPAPNAYFVRTDDLLTDYDATKDKLWTA